MTTSNLMSVVDKCLIDLIDKVGCGWMDGGCMTLASAVNQIFPDSIFYHISRCVNLVDHVVLYFPEKAQYFDADGFQSERELFIKMKKQELTDVSALVEMNESHFNQIEIFTELEVLFIKYYNEFIVSEIEVLT